MLGTPSGPLQGVAGGVPGEPQTEHAPDTCGGAGMPTQRVGSQIDKQTRHQSAAAGEKRLPCAVSPLLWRSAAASLHWLPACQADWSAEVLRQGQAGSTSGPPGQRVPIAPPVTSAAPSRHGQP